MNSVAPFRPIDQQVFDVVVFGGGYAGYAAALRLAGRDQRVLLVERRAALLHESGWGFSLETGRSDAAEWGDLIGLLARHGAHDRADNGQVDGAIAEVLAARQIMDRKLPVLFYVQPVAAWHDGDGRIAAVAVAGKGGVRVLRAARWIDTTDEGELLAVLSADWQRPAPARQTSNLFFRHHAWRDDREAEFASDQLPGVQLSWRTSRWANERVLSLSLPGDFTRHRAAWQPALELLHARQPELMHQAVLTHASVEPVAAYEPAELTMALPDNVIAAVAGRSGRAVRTLADRFDLGLSAAERAVAMPARKLADPPFEFGQQIQPARTASAEVIVAGAGTGGVFAALAAARSGAKVLAIEPMPFVGGIGTGGGIHFYYYGVKGGMQEEIDERTRQIMHLFGTTQQVMGFHPDAKKLVIENLLTEAGVHLLTGSTLFAVETRDRRITSAAVTTPGGPVAVTGEAWIDSTGDGDLAAMAGAPYQFGRVGDGQLHAYSQSSGRVGIQDDVARMHVVNYDAGFVDPTDAEDLTRARLVGVTHYVQQRFTELARPTYIAPALGIRQGRQIRTRYMVTLADLIERRTFEDAVGLTGCHYDNHAVDYEFESDEALFWVWCCRQWSRGRTACQMPYRMMLPENLDNVWIACRAIGVSEEAHHSLRMQRDLQRLGEAAGLAAALATREHLPAPQVPYAPLRAQLEKSGALQAQEESPDPFGAHQPAAQFISAGEATPEQVTAWAEAVRRDFCAEMYKLMRAGLPGATSSAEARQQVMAMLAEADENISWRAATILAMWSDSAAEPRLLAAVRSREYGFSADERYRPEQFNRVVPNWVVAVALLRRCGTPACLADLWELSRDAGLLHNQRTTLAMTCQHLLERLKLTPEQKDQLLETVRRLLETPAPNAQGSPQRKPVTIEPTWVLEPEHQQAVVEDFSWQLHLAVARAELAAGVPVHSEAQALLVDPRAMVRRAFNRILQRY